MCLRCYRRGRRAGHRVYQRTARLRVSETATTGEIPAAITNFTKFRFRAGTMSVSGRPAASSSTADVAGQGRRLQRQVGVEQRQETVSHCVGDGSESD